MDNSGSNLKKEKTSSRKRSKKLTFIKKKLWKRKKILLLQKSLKGHEF